MMGDWNMVALLNPGMAFLAGLVASLHCVAMCGPLSCALLGDARKGNALPGQLLYHGGRFVAYTTFGAAAGFLGGEVISWTGANLARYVPWGFVLFFLALFLGIDGWVTGWQARRGYGRSLLQRAYRTSGRMRGLALGLATPLIPCAPLYFMLWVTTMSGSAQGGILVMGGYALGTMPLLLLAQRGWAWLGARTSPETMRRLRRGLALLAMALVGVRAFMDTGAQAILEGDALCN